MIKEVKKHVRRMVGCPVDAEAAFLTVAVTTEILSDAEYNQKIVSEKVRKKHDRAGIFLEKEKHDFWSPRIAIMIGIRNAAIRNNDFSRAQFVDERIKDRALSY